MTLLPLLLLSASSPSQGDAARLKAVEDTVALARAVQSVCQPRLLTNPPRSIRIVEDLPVGAWRARGDDPGEYYVSYNRVRGFVGPNGLELNIYTWPSTDELVPYPYPDGARLWTRAELEVNARAVCELIKPPGTAIGEVYSLHPEDPSETNFRFDLGLVEDPRLRVVVRDVDMDPWIGMPTLLKRRPAKIPAVAPERIRGILDEDVLIEEVLSLHRSLALFGPAKLYHSSYDYMVPAFLRQFPNELTAVQLGHIAHDEAFPIYRFMLMIELRTGRRWREIFVDARTGRAMAYEDSVTWFNHLGRMKDLLKPFSAPTTGRWRLGKVEGAFAKVRGAVFAGGVPFAVMNEKREVLTLGFDRKSGLISDEKGVYRPDAGLLAALRKLPPARGFGKAGSALGSGK